MTEMYPHSFLNDSAETIPSYAVIQIQTDEDSEADSFDFKNRIPRASQYKAGESSDVVAINGPSSVEPRQRGMFSFAVDGPTWARTQDTEALINLDENKDWREEEFGPLDAKWSLGPQGSGFQVLCRPQKQGTATYHRVLVIRKVATELTLMKSTETSRILGPQSSFLGGSSNTTGKACIVNRETGLYDYTKEYDVNTTRLKPGAVIMPNLDGSYPLNAQYLFEAIKMGSVFYAVTGGTTVFEGRVVTDEGSGLYTVTPLTPVGADPITCKTLFTGSEEAFIVDQLCWVQMQGSTPRVTHGGCVP